MVARMNETRCFLGDLLREPDHRVGCFSHLDPFVTFAGLHSTPEFGGQINPKVGSDRSKKDNLSEAF